MKLLTNYLARELETPAVITLSGNGFVNENTNEATILRFKGASSNLSFTDKRKNKNNSKLKRRLQKLTSALLISVLFFSLSTTVACAESPEPKEVDRLLPFPLNNTKWVELFGYPTYVPGKYKYGIRTISIHQVEDNKSELYISEKISTGTYVYNHETKKYDLFEDTTWIEPTFLYGLIIVEDKKVYVQFKDSRDDIFYQKILLYDFGLNLGDTFRTRSYVGALDAIDSVLIDGKYRKRYNFDLGFSYNDTNYYKLYVIEGIGNTNFFTRTITPVEIEHHFPDLLGVYYNDKLIWKNDLIRDVDYYLKEK